MSNPSREITIQQANKADQLVGISVDAFLAYYQQSDLLFHKMEFKWAANGCTLNSACEIQAGKYFFM